MAGLGAKADFFTTFHQLCSKVLSPLERQVLQQALQAYRTSGIVADLVSDTAALWTAPAKLQLLPFVRQVVSLPDRHYFDALLGIHEGYVVRGPRSDVSKASTLSSSKSGNHPTAIRGGVHVIKIGSSASPRMGFSIRGGSEFGLGIFVSHVDPDSSAERGGLKCGDQILESNGVELETASSQRAEELLSRTHSHTLVVRRTRKIPEWKVTKERLLWYDVATRKLVAAPSGEITAVDEPGSEVSEVQERKVVLKLTRSRDFIGLNIRGGKDFGLGIYVSRVDPGGLAERAGVEVGDRLVQVNKQRLDNVSHASVVQLLRSNRQLVLTLWAVGRFPAYKELFTEFVWSDIGDYEESASKAPLTHTAELHPEPRVKARHKTGRVTQRTKARESRVDRYSRDSGIDLNGIDLQQVQRNRPDPDYDDVELEDEDGLPIQPELFYPRDKDIIFRGNYAHNWRHLDQEYGAEDAAPSIVSDQRPSSSSATYGARAVSMAGTDSHSSDEDMDYTTFLERKARRDEQKASTKHHHPARETVSAAQNNRRTTASSHDDHVIQVLPSTSEATEPTLLRATDRREPSLVKTADRVERTTLATTSTAAADSAEPMVVKTDDRRTDNSEPVLVKTVIRVDAATPAHEILTQSLDSNRSVDRREERHIADFTQKEAVRHEVAQDGDIYAVVTKPPRKQQPGSQSSDFRTSPSPAPPLSSLNHRSRPHDIPSASSSSEHSDDDDDDSNSSAASPSRGRHHRTHIYHINTSPVVKKKLHPDAAADKRRKPKTSHKRTGAKEEDEDYVVVTEVMDEVAFQPPSPSLDYRRSSLASSTSNSDSTVTEGGEERKRKEEGAGGGGSVDQLSEEIKRLEARQSNIGSREISSLADIPDSKEKNSKTEEDKKVGKWSALKKKLTSSMRIKKSSKQPKVTTNPEIVSMGSIRKKGIFERSFGSQMMNQQTEEKYNLMMVEERARHLLPKDENDAVLRHIKKYQEERDLDRLVDMLMVILDNPEKLILLKDIRGVVLPCHVGRFDSRVARHEQTSFDGTSSKLHLPLSPMHRSDSRTAKPRPKLITTVIDSDGHFHIQSIDNEERDRQLQVEVVDAFQSQVKNKALNNNNNSINDHSNHQPYQQQQQQQQQQNVYNSSKDWTSPPKRINGVAHRNRLNNDMSTPLPPDWRDDVREVIIVEKAPIPPPPSPPPPEEGFLVYLSKQKKNLGLIVCGGAGDHMDPSVRIEMVMPWGAAADDERIVSGMHILSVEDQSVKGLTQSEAIALLKRCFTDTRSVNMKLRLKMP